MERTTLNNAAPNQCRVFCRSFRRYLVTSGYLELKELSEAEAPSLITDLVTNEEEDKLEAPDNDDPDRPSHRMPRAVSPKQLKYLRDLIEEEDLAYDGVIDQEGLFSRLNVSTASKLTAAFKYIP